MQRRAVRAIPQVFTSAGEFKSPGVEIPIQPRDGKFFAIHFHFSHKFSASGIRPLRCFAQHFQFRQQ